MMDHILEPTLIVDRNKCLANISRMAEKARAHNLIFRPHFKTHQSREVGEWFRECGITKITVSSVSMARHFSADWDEITIAFPLNPREIGRINSIDPKVCLNLTIENTEALEIAAKELERKVGVFIKIDTGYKRTGIWYSDNKKIFSLIERIEQNSLLNLRGLLIHAGHTYGCSTKEEVLAIHKESLDRIREMRVTFKKAFPGLIVSYGDTPSCSLADDFSGIDEIRPGNFAYYDLMQARIGSCSFDDIAVAVACPVVAKHPERNQITLYGGAVHFSKEFLFENGRKIFGKMVQNSKFLEYPSRGEGTIISLSQEHGTLEITDPKHFKQIQVGDLVFIHPIHSCLTANLLPSTHIH